MPVVIEKDSNTTSRPRVRKSMEKIGTNQLVRCVNHNLIKNYYMSKEKFSVKLRMYFGGGTKLEVAAHPTRLTSGVT